MYKNDKYTIILLAQFLQSQEVTFALSPMTIGIIEGVWKDVDLCREFKDSVFRTCKCSLRRWKEEGEEEGKERRRERREEE